MISEERSSPVGAPRGALRARRLVKVSLVCVVVAAVVQIPIAWACAWIGRGSTPPWRNVFLTRPMSVESDTDRIVVGFISHMGVRAVSVEAWPPVPVTGTGPPMAQPGSAEVIAACSPWTPDEVHPALMDLSEWPKHTGVYSRPNLFHTEPLAFRVASGWPLLCVEGRIEYTSSRQFEYVGILTDPRFLPPPTAEAGYLCHHPRWPALIANTGIHAAILATLCLLAAFAFRTIRARSRRCRNLCPSCAYDLRHTAQGQPCPECGKPCEFRRI